jgi:hypothetical protein
MQTKRTRETRKKKTTTTTTSTRSWRTKSKLYKDIYEESKNTHTHTHTLSLSLSRTIIKASRRNLGIGGVKALKHTTKLHRNPRQTGASSKALRSCLTTLKTLLASGKGRRRDDDDDNGAGDCLLPQRNKKTQISEPNFKTKQRNGGNKTNTQTKQSTRSSALTALVGSENGVFWYFGHTTRVVCLPSFVFV